jgi:hypothetical protein
MGLERLVRTLLVSSVALLPASCAFPPNTHEARVQTTSVYDVVHTVMDQFVNNDFPAAEAYLESVVRSQKHPHVATQYLLALTYASEGTMPKLEESGALFDRIITTFQVNWLTLNTIREALPNELFELPLYKQDKKRLAASAAFTTRVYPIVALMSLVDGDYDLGIWAANGARKYSDPNRVKRCAEQLDLCIQFSLENGGSSKEYVGMHKMRKALLGEE